MLALKIAVHLSTWVCHLHHCIVKIDILCVYTIRLLSFFHHHCTCHCYKILMCDGSWHISMCGNKKYTHHTATITQGLMSWQHYKYHSHTIMGAIVGMVQPADVLVCNGARTSAGTGCQHFVCWSDIHPGHQIWGHLASDNTLFSWLWLLCWVGRSLQWHHVSIMASPMSSNLLFAQQLMFGLLIRK